MKIPTYKDCDDAYDRIRDDKEDHRQRVMAEHKERLEYERRAQDIDKKQDGQSYLDLFQLD
tara:strand:- start:38 stop:220 length:183 start_codon:yes stop_codon:yes gene_type:complete